MCALTAAALINILLAPCTRTGLMLCQLKRGEWLEREINAHRRAECLHFMAAGLIVEECEDVSVMSALDKKDYRSFRAKQQDLHKHQEHAGSQ